MKPSPTTKVCSTVVIVAAAVFLATIIVQFFEVAIKLDGIYDLVAGVSLCIILAASTAMAVLGLLSEIWK
jgi:hypothetical protein